MGYQITDPDEAKNLFLCEMQDRLFTGARGSYLMKGEATPTGFSFSEGGELTTFDLEDPEELRMNEGEEAIILILRVCGIEFVNDADMASKLTAYYAGVPAEELDGAFSAIVSSLHSKDGLTRVLQSRIKEDGSLSEVLDTGASSGEHKKDGFLFLSEDRYIHGYEELTTEQSAYN